MNRFTKLLSFAVVSSALWLFAPSAGALTFLDAQTTNVSSTAQSIMTASAVYVQVRSTGASTAVVTIETSLDQLAWTTAATVTNPTISGEIWAGPGGGFLRVTISGYAAGTITVKANAVRGSDTLF